MLTPVPPPSSPPPSPPPLVLPVVPPAPPLPTPRLKPPLSPCATVSVLAPKSPPSPLLPSPLQHPHSLDSRQQTELGIVVRCCLLILHSPSCGLFSENVPQGKDESNDQSKNDDIADRPLAYDSDHGVETCSLCSKVVG